MIDDQSLIDICQLHTEKLKDDPKSILVADHANAIKMIQHMSDCHQNTSFTILVLRDLGTPQ